MQQATLFQDLVNRCVKYAFAELPVNVGRVFFSKGVALPFMRFRMLRHGIMHSPIHWKEINRDGLRGVFMVLDETRRPDIVVYYCHGGGFAMGSPYFYMEFLMAWISQLGDAGYTNPAVFALDYTLCPEATYPTQLQEALAGYKYVLSIASDPSQIVVSGDSAGGTLILSLLLCLSNFTNLKHKMPGLAVLISPWTTILSEKNRDTPSDYLNANTLHIYGSQYIGSKASPNDALVSPGSCTDLGWWRRASPTNGMYFIHGAEEVFAPDIKDVLAVLRKAEVDVSFHEERHWIHAWPVVKLFLCNERQARLSGVKSIVDAIKDRLRSEIAR